MSYNIFLFSILLTQFFFQIYCIGNSNEISELSKNLVNATNEVQIVLNEIHDLRKGENSETLKERNGVGAESCFFLSYLMKKIQDFDMEMLQILPELQKNVNDEVFSEILWRNFTFSGVLLSDMIADFDFDGHDKFSCSGFCWHISQENIEILEEKLLELLNIKNEVIVMLKKLYFEAKTGHLNEEYFRKLNLKSKDQIDECTEFAFPNWFQSPNFPKNYPSNEILSKTYLALEPLSKVVIIFTNFDVESSPTCEYDSLDIKSAVTDLPISICGKMPNRYYEFNSSIVEFEFKSDSNIEKKGFRGIILEDVDECSLPGGNDCEEICLNTVGGYFCMCNEGEELSEDGKTCTAPCGGILTSSSGIIQSPNYPDAYPNNSKCIWDVNLSSGSNVWLTFHDFEIEWKQGTSCSVVDYLGISAKNVTSNVKLCGSNLPDVMKFETNAVTLKFVSDGSIGARGFNLTYQEDVNECTINNEHGCEHICINTLGSYYCKCRPGYKLSNDGRKCKAICGSKVYTAFSSSIQSPGFPQPFGEPHTCLWNIVAEKNKQIVITTNLTDERPGDFFKIMEGEKLLSGSQNSSGSEVSPVIQNVQRSSVRSLSNKISVLLECPSGEALFTANFVEDEDECKTGNHGCSHTCVNNIGSYFCTCPNGYKLLNDKKTCKAMCTLDRTNSNNGALYSPNYPMNYPLNFHCKQTITPPEGETFVLEFLEFEMEEPKNGTCLYDKVIINGTMEYCGKKLPEKLEFSEPLDVEFISDKTRVAKGFVAVYYILSRYYESGVITSPNYPENYPINEERYWHLTTSGNSRIRIYIEDFSLEYHGTCSYDFLQMFNGATNSSNSLTKICGTGVSREYYSNGPDMLLYFKTDEKRTDKGFKLRFSSERNSNTIRLSPRPLTVRSMDSRNSEFRLTAPSQYRILLKFSDTRIVYQHTSNLYLNLYDNNSIKYSVGYSYNTRPNFDILKIPKTYLSSSNEVRIQISNHLQCKIVATAIQIP